MGEPGRRILLLEDHVDLQLVYRHSLERAMPDAGIDAAADMRTARALLRENAYDLGWYDCMFPWTPYGSVDHRRPSPGIALAEETRLLRPEMLVVVVSADEGYVRAAREKGFPAYRKPVMPHNVLHEIGLDVGYSR